MRAATANRRSARVALALLTGLLVGGWVGGGLVWVFNRNKYSANATIPDPALTKADELELVPPDALGFVHLRLADVWKTEGFAEFRKVVAKAGPEALKALDDGFIPSPSSIERVTLVIVKAMPPPVFPTTGKQPDRPPAKKGGGGMPALPPNGPPPGFKEPQAEPEAVVLIAFSAPYDAEKFRLANFPNATKKNTLGKEYWVDSDSGYAVQFANEKLLVVGQTPAMEVYLRPLKTEGPLSGALRLAAGGTRHVVAAVNLKDGMAESAGSSMRKLLPAEVAPLLKADSMAVGVVFGTGMKMDLRAVYKDEPTADEAEKAVKAAAEAGRKALAEPKKKMEEAVKGPAGGPKPRPIQELPEALGGLFGLGAINWLDEFLADPNLATRKGNELIVEVNLPSMMDATMRANALALAMLVPSVQKVREAAGRMTDSNNLKQIGLAMHMYHDAMGRFPPIASTGLPEKKGNLSWRVHILPYLEQQQLYQEFHLDEPWDSDHNKPLIDKMPKVYVCPTAPTPAGQTYYKVFVGGGAMFDPKVGTNFTSVQDGLSNTFMVAEGGDPVIWTKPDDFTYDPEKPLPKLGLPGSDTINVLMADGSVRSLNLKTVSEKTIRALITKAGDETIPPNWEGDAAPMPKIPAPKLGAPPAPPPLPKKE